MPEADLRRGPWMLLMLTNACNARCVSCRIWQEGGMMPAALDLNRVIPFIREALSATPLRCLGITGGEPFLRGAALMQVLRSVFADIRSRRLNEFNITSNGSFPERVEAFLKGIPGDVRRFVSMNISLDGLEKTHNEVRGVSIFNKTLQTLRVSKSCQVRTVINCTVAPYNVREIYKLYRLAVALGATLEMEMFSAYNPAYYHYYSGALPQPSDDAGPWKEVLAQELHKIMADGALACNRAQLQVLLASLGDVGVARKMAASCRSPAELCFVRATGEIYGCPHAPAIGDIYHSSWSDLERCRAEQAVRLESGGCVRCLSTMGSLNEAGS